MGLLVTIMPILLVLPVSRSNSLGEFSNSEVGLHQILQRLESLEARLSECNRKAEQLEQYQWNQRNMIRLQESKTEQLESRVRTMDENGINVKKLENKLKEALEMIDKLVNEVEMTKLRTRHDNISSTQFQACNKCEEYMQHQSLYNTAGGSNIDHISSNGKISGRISNISRTKRTSGPWTTGVAFAVTMVGWNELSLALQELIPFNVVQLNDGNGFDSNLKSFVCPVTGIYFFTASICTFHHKFEASIVIDGTEKVRISTGDGTGFQQGSNSFVSHCSKGQRVYVYNYQGGLTNTGDLFCMFSGFLITEQEMSS